MQMATKPGDLIVTRGMLSRFLRDDRESWMAIHDTYHACLPSRIQFPVAGYLTEKTRTCRVALVAEVL